MANRSLGTLTIDLIAKIGGWTQGLTKAERELDARTKRMNKMANDFGRSIGASIKSAFTGFLAFAGVTVSIGAVTASLKDAIDRADELRDASIRLGVGVDVLSKWSYAAKQTGTDIDSLQKGLKILSKNAAEALDPKSKQAGLFDALGVSKDSLTDLTKLVPQLADAFQRLPDGVQKAAVAQELFGKSGLELTEFLNSGSKGLDEFGDKAAKLGLVMSQDTANAADEFNDKLADLKSAFTGLSTQVAAELLPELTKIVDWAVEFVSDGENAKGITDGITSAMNDLGDAANDIGALIGALQGLQDSLAKAAAEATNLVNSLPGGETAQGIRAFAASHPLLGALIPVLGAAGNLEKLARQGNGANFNNVIGNVHGTFDGVRGNVDTVGAGSGNSALNKYFGGGGSSSKGGSGGKSQQQKDAEQLDAAYQRMNESLNEQIALFGKTSETAKERYELENGELAKLDPARKAALTTLLDTVDQMNAEKDLQEKLTKIEQERQDQIDRAQENAKKQIEDMQFELSLIGLTNKEREREIALRYATADATDAQKASIAALSDQLDEAHKRQDFFDEFQRSLSDSLYNVVTGAESAKDAIKGFFDNLAQYITRMIADNWAEKIASMFQKNAGGASGGDSGGGFWSSLLGALFSGGSGHAYGGNTSPWSVSPVNERGFEMASVGGKDYMLTGPKPVHITPNNRLAANGPVAVNQQFVLQGRIDSRTASQMAQQAGNEARKATARNGR